MAPQGRRCFGEAAQHHAVPRAQYLVITQWMDPLFPHCQQGRFSPLDDGNQPVQLQSTLLGESGGFLGHVEDVLAFEIAGVGNSEEPTEDIAFFVAQDGAQLLGCPDEELALFPFAVGVLGRVETALGVGHLSQHVVQGFLRDAAVKPTAGNQMAVEVKPGQQSVVVQHFLEVGHQPVGVG